MFENVPGIRISAITGASCFIFGLLAAYVVPVPRENSSMDLASFISKSETFDFKVYNEYGNVANPAYPWRLVAEPFRMTTLESTGKAPQDACIWNLEYRKTEHRNASHNDFLQRDDDTYTTAGCLTGFQFKKLGTWRVTLTEVSEEGSKAITNDIMVKYIRREIRKLTDRDREYFFCGVMMLARIPTHTGQLLYGEKYKSKDFLNRMHLYYGGRADCDHWHKGAGFVTSHMGLTLLYEQALQSVFSQVTVPYWDFTLESTFYEPDTFRSSPVFDDTWFGDASPSNSLRAVASGRWAFTPTMSNAYGYSDVTNSYGLLKAPWNNDPTPFLTRSSELYGYTNNLKPSGCVEYANTLTVDNWMALSKQLNAAAHGHIHELLGGAWNHDVGQRIKSQQFPAVFTFAHEVLAESKELWRNSYMACPEFCSVNTPWEECKCSCDNSEAARGREPKDTLFDSGILDSVDYYDSRHHLIHGLVNETTGLPYDKIPGCSAQESDVLYSHIFDDLCQPGHTGDMFQATSSNDITFWVLHPTVDRLWHWKRLAQDPNFNETWDPYHSCYGHNPEDLQPFANLFDLPSHDVFYSNQEIKDLLHPMREELTYMYDDFNWRHCNSLGYSMSNLLDTTL